MVNGHNSGGSVCSLCLAVAAHPAAVKVLIAALSPEAAPEVISFLPLGHQQRLARAAHDLETRRNAQSRI